MLRDPHSSAQLLVEYLHIFTSAWFCDNVIWMVADLKMTINMLRIEYVDSLDSIIRSPAGLPYCHVINVEFATINKLSHHPQVVAIIFIVQFFNSSRRYPNGVTVKQQYSCRDPKCKSRSPSLHSGKPITVEKPQIPLFQFLSASKTWHILCFLQHARIVWLIVWGLSMSLFYFSRFKNLGILLIFGSRAIIIWLIDGRIFIDFG